VGRGGAILNKQEQLKFERLERMLEAERERSEKAWSGYRDALYELVDLKIKIEQIEKVLNGNEQNTL
jgi:hypothetical protein